MEHCNYCGKYAAVCYDEKNGEEIKACEDCIVEIKAGKRSKKGVLRDDCPLHPGKKIWCKNFSGLGKGYLAKSRVCRQHYAEIEHKRTRKWAKEKLRKTQLYEEMAAEFSDDTPIRHRISAAVCLTML